MDNSFPKSKRLLNRGDFDYLLQGASFASSGLFLFFYKPSRDNSVSTRIGISVSGKACNATRRNYIKRCIREIFRKSQFTSLSKDIVIVLNQKKFKTIEQAKLSFERDLLEGFKKIVNS